MNILQDLTKLKGDAAEERCIKVACSLKTHVISARLSSERLDHAGIDVIITAYTADGRGSIEVPVQVKSSYTGVSNHKRKYPQHISAGVIIIRISDTRYDAEIREELRTAIEYIQRRGWNFNKMLRPVRRQRNRPEVHVYAAHRGHKKRLLQLIRMQEAEAELVMHH